MFEDLRIKEQDGKPTLLVRSVVSIPNAPRPRKRRNGAGTLHEFPLPVKWTREEWDAFSAVCHHYGVVPSQKVRELLSAWAALVAP